MNTHELEELKQARYHLSQVIGHKRPCQVVDSLALMTACGNIADCYVLLHPDDPEGTEKPTFLPSCEYHAHGKQRVTLTDWQERVVEEREELNQRLVSLEKFFDTAGFVILSCDNQRMLQNQRRSMFEYKNILTARIMDFAGGYDIELPNA